MDNPRHLDAAAQADRPETAAGKWDRLAREAEMIAGALASARACLVIDAAEADAWIGSLGTGHALPVSCPRR